MNPDDLLPRLAYVGEVPVRNISAGPALLYRLLESYPRDRLLLIESDHNAPAPALQLPVPHAPFFLMHQRLMCSRLSEPYSAWVYRHAAARGRKLVPRLRKFRAEAVLGLGHGFGWQAADAAARAMGVPLHLLVHDHWRASMMIPARLNADAEHRFAEVYRGAATRLPISPAMEAHYRHRYGAAGIIVRPSRGADALDLAEPPLRQPTPNAFVFAYAGSAGSAGQRRTLIDFAHAIAPLGARLRIYQGMELDLLRREGLGSDNVELAAFRPAHALHQDLMASVDAMYLPMSFAPEDRDNVELCFPSKLADYTVAGLPILVRGPAYSTAAHWAGAYPGVAELVTTAEAAPLTAAARRIITHKAHRHALAKAALANGRELFSQRAVFQTFANALRSVR